MIELKNKDISNEEIVKRYISFGVPYVFANNEQLYFDLKKEIANFLPVKSLNSIIVVGSSKLGFSIAPHKNFRCITPESDIDVAIIDEVLFDLYWEKLFEFNIGLTSRTDVEQKTYDKFLTYFFRGWLRPDLFPFDFDGKQEWFDFFTSISYKKYDKRKINGAIYKNEYFFEKYHQDAIQILRRRVIYGK